MEGKSIYLWHPMVSAVIVVCSTRTRKLAKSCSFENVKSRCQNLDGVDLPVLISHISGFLQVVLGLFMPHRKTKFLSFNFAVYSGFQIWGKFTGKSRP